MNLSQVICGGRIGTLDIARTTVIVHAGTPTQAEISLNDFERAGGHAATKKWKTSIRVLGRDGAPGKCIGEWLALRGCARVACLMNIVLQYIGDIYHVRDTYILYNTQVVFFSSGMQSKEGK